jgi:hypothetical protein
MLKNLPQTQSSKEQMQEESKSRWKTPITPIKVSTAGAVALRQCVREYIARVDEMEYRIFKNSQKIYAIRKDRKRNIREGKKAVRKVERKLVREQLGFNSDLKVHRNLVDALICTSVVLDGTIFRGDPVTVTQKVAVLIFASEHDWISPDRFRKAYPKYDCAWEKTTMALRKMDYLATMGKIKSGKHYITVDGKAEVERLKALALAAWKIPEKNYRAARLLKKRAEQKTEESGGV